MNTQLIEQLAALHGTWIGKGRGEYPTIDAFEYSECLQFEVALAYPLIFYQQRTSLSSGEPAHWESGFWRATEDDQIEASNSQESGRVEVLRGHASMTAEALTITRRASCWAMIRGSFGRAGAFDLPMTNWTTRSTCPPAQQNNLCFEDISVPRSCGTRAKDHGLPV